jgi:hypothetical protein
VTNLLERRAIDRVLSAPEVVGSRQGGGSEATKWRRSSAQRRRNVPNTLSNDDWDILLASIKRQRCTPFLGAGACYGILPLGGQIAEEWAEQYDYPLPDRNNLIRVAQFMAVKQDSMAPKFAILEHIEGITLPKNDADEPHTVLAEMQLPVYVTTNYDNFMTEALRRRYRKPRREYCRWNTYLKTDPGVFDDQDYVPDAAEPVVFHLHGNDTVAESLVLTEDDYLEFLVALSADPRIVPGPIRKAMVGSSLLFIGYSLADSTFRVLLRGLTAVTASNIRQKNFAVQLLPFGDTTSDEERIKMQNYLDRYFHNLNIAVYWGTAREFTQELRQRWAQYGQPKPHYAAGV